MCWDGPLLILTPRIVDDPAAVNFTLSPLDLRHWLSLNRRATAYVTFMLYSSVRTAAPQRQTAIGGNMTLCYRLAPESPLFLLLPDYQGLARGRLDLVGRHIRLQVPIHFTRMASPQRVFVSSSTLEVHATAIRVASARYDSDGDRC